MQGENDDLVSVHIWKNMTTKMKIWNLYWLVSICWFYKGDNEANNSNSGSTSSERGEVEVFVKPSQVEKTLLVTAKLPKHCSAVITIINTNKHHFGQKKTCSQYFHSYCSFDYTWNCSHCLLIAGWGDCWPWGDFGQETAQSEGEWAAFGGNLCQLRQLKAVDFEFMAIHISWRMLRDLGIIGMIID